MERKPKHFLNKTSYPGGVKALREFIESNLIYPEEAMKQNISGVVSLTFDVDYKGHVSNEKIKHGLGAGCDEEALRLVRLMKYTATKNRGLRVTFHETMNIAFDLKKYMDKKNRDALKNQDVQKQIQITYNVVSDEKKSQSPVHTYSIKIN